MKITEDRADILKKVQGVDLLFALDVANELRETCGFEKLDDFVPGYISDSSSCVLANTFNCNCIVDYGDCFPDSDNNNAWYRAKFHDRDKNYAEALAKELGVEVVDCGGDDSVYYHLSVELPAEIGKIAWIFDEGMLSEYDASVIGAIEERSSLG